MIWFSSTSIPLYLISPLDETVCSSSISSAIIIPFSTTVSIGDLTMYFSPVSSTVQICSFLVDSNVAFAGRIDAITIVNSLPETIFLIFLPSNLASSITKSSETLTSPPCSQIVKFSANFSTQNRFSQAPPSPHHPRTRSRSHSGAGLLSPPWSGKRRDSPRTTHASA